MASIKHFLKYRREEVEGKHNWIDTITWTVVNFKQIMDEGRDFKLVSEEFSKTLELPKKRSIVGLVFKHQVIYLSYVFPKASAIEYKVRFNFKKGHIIAKKAYFDIQNNDKSWNFMLILSNDTNYVGNKIISRTIPNSLLEMAQMWHDHYLTPDDNLHIIIEFKVTLNEDNSNDKQVDALNEDFEKLFCEGLFSDVTMMSAEGASFPVHKNILASRSAVLKAHFVHDTTESRTNTVESPFDTDVLQEVLIFMYSNAAPKVEEMPDKLLEAADYYQLDRLKELCVRVLRGKLTVENAVDTLQLADRYRDDSLKQATMHFIREQSPNSIMNSEGWANLKCVHLLKMISRSFVEDDYDPDILKQESPAN